MAIDKTKLKQKLTDKYRLVILNEDTFQERFSLKLSRLNVFVFSGIFSIIIIIFTAFLISFTSLKEYIPGYSSTELKKQATRLVYEADSLKSELAVLQNFTKAIKPVLTGEITADSLMNSRNVSKKIEVDEVKLSASKKDSLFRKEVEERDRFPLLENIQNKAKIVFFAPLTGTITQKFDAVEKHYAVDVVAKKGTPVKAVADGTVIFSEWTAETGYVLMVQHANEFISVYKHNGSLLKKQGDFVKSGEVIAAVGSTGEHTTGPHLHFELWNKGYSVDPEDYINFQ